MGHDPLLNQVTFRIRVAVGSTLLAAALFATTLPAWFSDNPGAGSAPSSGLIEHWNFWAAATGAKGAGNWFPIGASETALAEWLGALLALTLVALVLTATECRWRLALTTAAAGAASFVVEIVLRVTADSDHQGNPGPHSYNPAGGLALAQWVTAAIVAWALWVMASAIRDSR